MKEKQQTSDVVCVSSSQSLAAPKVSVVMSVYNNEEYLGEAIDSILNQSFDDFEFVIVDDGSAEPTRSLLEQYADRSAKITLVQQPNGGISRARNIGLAHSRGQYIAVMDSDDIALLQRLAIQSAFLDATPECAVVGSSFYSISADGDLINLESAVTDSSLVGSYLLTFFSLHHPTMMFRKDVMHAVGGYNKDGAACEDYNLALRVLCSGYRLTNLPSFLMKWRHTPTGVTFGRATYQTECGSRFRDRSLNQLRAQKPNNYYDFLDILVREFPAGSEFDEKIAQMGVTGFNDPVMHWLKAAESRQDIPFLDVAAVRFLNDISGQYADFAAALETENHGCLSGVVSSIGKPPVEVTLPINSVEFRTPDSTSACTILLPIGKNIRDFELRLANILEQDARVGEVLVYQDHSLDSEFTFNTAPERVRFIGQCNHYDALAFAEGEFISVLDEGVRWYSGFLSESISILRAKPALDAVYAATGGVDVDVDGLETIIPDPSIPGRLSQDAVAGQGRVYGAGFVVRRDAFSALHLNPQEMGSALFWAIGRELVACRSVEVLDNLNGSYNVHNLSRGAVFHALVWVLDWYYRSCFGLIPYENEAEPRKRDDGTVASQVSSSWSSGAFRVYWGNLSQVRRFYSESVDSPMKYPIFKSIMLSGGVVAAVKACFAQKKVSWIIPLLAYYVSKKIKMA